MSQILVDIQAKTICVDDYILFHAATDFIIQNATARNFILTISTHQGIILFRVGNFVDDGVNLTARVNLISDGLVDAFRHVPHNGCRKFLLNIHDRNASFVIQFSDELIIWNDITHTSDMNEYALKTEIPDVSSFITVDSLTPYVKKTDLPDFRTYALKSELFSRKYNDLNGKPDLSVYALKTDVLDVSEFITSDDLPDFGTFALKTELPNLGDYALKSELFSKKYSDLTGTPDLNLYALKTEIPDGVDLSGYLTITAAAETYAGKSHTHSEYALKTEIPDVSGFVTSDDLPDFGTFALKTELPNLGDYALKSELFSKKYSDLTGTPDLNLYALKTEIPDGVDLSGYLTITAAAETYAGKSHTHSEYALKTEIPDVSGFVTSDDLPDFGIYALKSELPNLENYALKSELFSKKYSDLTGAPDLNLYALKTEIPDVSELQGADGTTFTPSLDAEGNLSWTNDGGLENPTPVNIKGNKGDTGDTGAAVVSFAVFTAVTDETTFAGTAQLINADGTAGETVDVVYDFNAPATGE